MNSGVNYSALEQFRELFIVLLTHYLTRTLPKLAISAKPDVPFVLMALFRYGCNSKTFPTVIRCQPRHLALPYGELIVCRVQWLSLDGVMGIK